MDMTWQPFGNGQLLQNIDQLTGTSNVHLLQNNQLYEILISMAVALNFSTCAK